MPATKGDRTRMARPRSKVPRLFRHPIERVSLVALARRAHAGLRTGGEFALGRCVLHGTGGPLDLRLAPARDV